MILAIKAGMNSYYKYVGDARTTVTLSDTKAIGDDYREGNRVPS